MANETVNKLEGWTKEEKFELLEALRDFGSQNIDQIKECVTTKSADEIRLALEFYRQKALAIPCTTQKKKERRLNNSNMPMIPLARWASFIVDTHGFEELQTETAAALRLIADFEDKPPTDLTEKIDFKKVYNALADALEGKPLVNDWYIMALFDKCIVETALTSKALIKSTAYFKQILRSALNPSGSNMNINALLAQNSELAYLRPLILQKNYNPLNISDNYLQFSTQIL